MDRSKIGVEKLELLVTKGLADLGNVVEVLILIRAYYPVIMVIVTPSFCLQILYRQTDIRSLELFVNCIELLPIG